MKFYTVFAVSGLFATAVSAFQTKVVGPTTRLSPLAVAQGYGTLDLTDTAERDVYSLQGWAQSCGAQTCDGFELTTQDGQDYSVITNQNVPQGSPVVYVPAGMIISSDSVEEEFGGNLEAAENVLEQLEGGQRKPLFRLVIKILSEYENGSQSPYFPWLNSLPRRFYNGVAMTGKRMRE